MERLWAPWRLEYVASNAPQEPGCFFCNAWKGTGGDEKHLVLKRGQKAFVIVNRFPYNCGHLMVVPATHYGYFDEATEDEVLEMWSLLALCKRILQKTMRAQGFNIGINQGKCAGTGVVEHLHIHIVPRWEGDANFMPVMTDTRIMSQSLEGTFKALREEFSGA